MRGVFPSGMQKSLEPRTFTQCLAPRMARPEASHQQALGTECFGKSNLYVSARKGELSFLKNLASSLCVEPCKYARTSVLTSLQILYIVNQACCLEHLWFLNLAQSSAKSVCEAGLGCVECPGWLTGSVVNKLCLLLSLHPANTAVITELYFLDTWK